MILNYIDSLIQEIEDHENTTVPNYQYYQPERPSFLSRHKGKLLAAGALAGGAIAGYKGLLGPQVQRAIADKAFQASTKITKGGVKLALSEKPKFVRDFGQGIAKLGAKSSVSTGIQALKARGGEFTDQLDKFGTAHKKLKDIYDTAKQQFKSDTSEVKK